MRLTPFYAPEDNDQEAPRSYSPEEVEALIEKRLQSERESFERSIAEQRTAREQAENALRENQQQLFHHEMREKAQAALHEKGLPAELMGMLNLSSEDTLLDTLQSAERAFRAALEEGVRARLRGTPPSVMPAAKTAKQKPLSYQQAANLYKTDRAAWDKRYGGM